MRYLFERLSDSLARRPADFDVRQAIQDQLQRLLVSHPGTAGDGDPHLLNFGLPALPDIRLDDPIHETRLCDRMAVLIGHYEPRLSDIRVQLEPTGDPLNPQRILVDAILPGAYDGRHMRFVLTPTSTGRAA